MNESALSLKLGLKGMPDAAENVMIARDIELSRLTGGRVHFCHVSTARGVELIRRAKEDGINVTAEVAPHHLTLTEGAVSDYNTLAKVSMPLRKEEDVEALIEGLRDGVIDCVASDHAPHEADSKNVEFDKASFGFIGLQTNLPLMLSLVKKEKLSLERVIESFTVAPARCLHLEEPSFKKGATADISIIDVEKEYEFSQDMICSKSKNSPFLNEKFRGAAVKTFVSGKKVFAADE